MPDLPLSSTDLRILVPCDACGGNGGYGSRTEHGSNPFNSCHVCEGTGWHSKRIPELRPSERERLIKKLG
jgi:hypothetical protein